LQIFIKANEKALLQAFNASDSSKLEAVTFLQRFGSFLNLHLHFHSVVIDGLFDEKGSFYPAGFLSSKEIFEVEKEGIDLSKKSRTRLIFNRLTSTCSDFFKLII